MMETKVNQQMTKEIEFVELFEVEELEARMEFKTWHGTSLEEELAKP